MTTETKALARAPANPDASELETIERMAAMLNKSGFAKGARSADQAAALILMGREVGLPAMQALSSIHVIEGKPTASAQLIGALLARGGVTWTVDRHDATGCTLTFRRAGFGDVTATFSQDDAARAGLAQKNIWRTYPRAMFFARAMTEGARMIGPDLLCGIAYTPEEMGAEVNADGEPVIARTANGSEMVRAALAAKAREADAIDPPSPEPEDQSPPPDVENMYLGSTAEGDRRVRESAGTYSGIERDRRPISEPQRKRLWAIAGDREHETGVTKETILRAVYQMHGIERTEQIAGREMYEAICAAVEAWQPDVPRDAGATEEG